MAVFARTRGGAAAGEFVGRDLVFVKVALTGIHTGYTAVDSDFEKTVRALQMYGTVTIVGVPASGVAMFVMEGISNIGTNAAIAASIDAATGGTSTVTQTAGLAASF